uniref:Uncharacterized protein n=1 Tax=Oryza nivara TaxID=4536 RepID=A0A0E0G246_ORYNI
MRLTILMRAKVNRANWALLIGPCPTVALAVGCLNHHRRRRRPPARYRGRRLAPPPPPPPCESFPSPPDEMLR